MTCHHRYPALEAPPAAAAPELEAGGFEADEVGAPELAVDDEGAREELFLPLPLSLTLSLLLLLLPSWRLNRAALLADCSTALPSLRPVRPLGS